MDTAKKLSPLTVLGSDTPSGAYVLRLRVGETLSLSFGRFKKGKVISVPAGECIYIGSAMGNKGALSLGRRLLRHATRTGPQPPHLIRSHLLEMCPQVGLGAGKLLPKRGKKLFWHIDYLLDHPKVELTHIILIRSSRRLEVQLGQLLAHDPHTFILEKGLGANDVAGNTHLLGVKADEIWWASLPETINQLVIV